MVGPLELDVDGHHVFVGEDEVHVSTLEMRLLVYLVENRGRVRSREDLLEDVWGYSPASARGRWTRTSSGCATSWARRLPGRDRARYRVPAL